jgi:hypothetical protein
MLIKHRCVLPHRSTPWNPQIHHGNGESDMKRPVALVTDTGLVDEVLNAAAVVGCEVERVVDVTALRGRWHGAAAVVLDFAAVVACGGFPRRPGVHVVGAGPPGEEVWRRALALGAEQVLELPADQERLRAVLADAAEGAPAGEAACWRSWAPAAGPVRPCWRWRWVRPCSRPVATDCSSTATRWAAVWT